MKQYYQFWKKPMIKWKKLMQKFNNKRLPYKNKKVEINKEIIIFIYHNLLFRQF